MKDLSNRDSCYVCSLRFNDVQPPGVANREEHHIIPRQAGGSNGPVVSLCDTHHSILHKIANTINSKNPKPYAQLLVGLSDLQKKKLLWLSVTAANAFKKTANDPNKKRSLYFHINQSTEVKMRKLQSVFPKKSRQDIIQMALDKLFDSRFI